MESINLAIEDRKKEDDDKKRRKDGRGRKSDKEQTAFINSTVQKKIITFPTDSKLLNKIIDYCHKIAKAEGIKVRQSFVREVKELKLPQRITTKSHEASFVSSQMGCREAHDRGRTSYRSFNADACA